MTGRKNKKVTKLYDRLSAQERVKMLFKADIKDEEADPEIKNSTPQNQIAACNHALGALNSIYNVIGPTAAEVMYRTNILQLQYVIAWTHILWAEDRRSLMSGEDIEDSASVPSNPEGVVQALTRGKKLIPDSELTPLDRITRSYLESVRTLLPQCAQEKNFVQQAYDQLRAEFGAEDIEEPLVRELLDDTEQTLETLRKSASWLTTFGDQEFDFPNPHFQELLENAIDVSRNIERNS